MKNAIFPYLTMVFRILHRNVSYTLLHKNVYCALRLVKKCSVAISVSWSFGHLIPSNLAHIIPQKGLVVKPLMHSFTNRLQLNYRLYVLHDNLRCDVAVVIVQVARSGNVDIHGLARANGKLH